MCIYIYICRKPLELFLGIETFPKEYVEEIKKFILCLIATFLKKRCLWDNDKYLENKTRPTR
jgi:hypothetical protein